MTIAFDHSVPAMLISGYGVVLAVSVVLQELASCRQLAGLDFAGLLDKLEPLWIDGVASGGSSISHSAAMRQHRTLNDRETLRRIAGNARVLAYLSQVQANQASPQERVIAKQIRADGLRLMILALVLRLAMPNTRRSPGAGPFVKRLGASYWSTVRRLQVLYGRHHTGQGAALKTAFNFNFCSNTA